jgi:hypothetical protein
MTLNSEFFNTFENFMNIARSIMTEYHHKNYPALETPTLSYEVGKKNIKVISTNYSSRSVYCFICCRAARSTSDCFAADCPATAPETIKRRKKKITRKKRAPTSKRTCALKTRLEEIMRSEKLLYGMTLG